MLNYLNWRYTGTEMIHGVLIMGQRDRCNGFYWERWRFFPTCILVFMRNDQKQSLSTSLPVWPSLIPWSWDPWPGSLVSPDQGHTPYLVVSAFFSVTAESKSRLLSNQLAWRSSLGKRCRQTFFFFFFFFHVFSSFCPPAGRCGCVCFTSSNEAGMYGQR